jgi:hypothetical protein
VGHDYVLTRIAVGYNKDPDYVLTRIAVGSSRDPDYVLTRIAVGSNKDPDYVSRSCKALLPSGNNDPNARPNGLWE